MNKVSTLFAAVCCAFSLTAGVSVPYSSNIADPSTQGIASDWTVIDIDNDGNSGNGQWAYKSTSSGTGLSGLTVPGVAAYTYHRSNAGNDWLVSPAIHLEAGKEYKLRYRLYAYNEHEKLKVVLADGNTVSELNSATVLNNFDPVTPKNTWQRRSNVITVDTDGDYYIGYYAYSEYNQWYIYLYDFSVCENVFTPAGVSDLTATSGTADSPRELTVTLNWTNPTADIDDVPFPDGTGVTAVKVYRDDVLAATLGAVETWTDTAATGLESGVHTYKVVAVVGETEAAAASVTAPYAGPLAPMSLPFTAGFGNSGYDEDSFNLMWTNAKGAESNVSTDWEFKAATYYMPGRITYRVYSSEIDGQPETVIEDSWLISPPLKFEHAGQYAVSVKAAVNSKQEEPKLRLAYGAECSAAGMTNVLSDNMNVEATSSVPANPQGPFIINVTEPGTYYVGIEAAARNTTFGTLYYLYDMTVSEYVVTPKQVTGLTATPAADGTTAVTLSWTNPTETTAGTALTDAYAVHIARNGEQIALLENTPGATETASYTDTPAAPGRYTYTVTATALGDTSDDVTGVSVTTGWLGDDSVQLPYTVHFDSSDETTLDLWSVVDGNDDGSTWEHNSYGYRLNQGAVDEYDLVSNKDYLVSPKMTLPAGEYTLSVTAKGEDMNVQAALIADSATVTNPSAYIGAQNFTGLNNVLKPYTATITVPTAGNYRLLIYNDGYTDWVSPYYALTVTEASISRRAVIPSVATNVAVTVAADYSLSSTVSWTNPATTDEGETLGAIEKAVIYRDNAVAGTVTEGLTPGATAQFTDTEIPVAGKYTYKVEVYTADGKSAQAAAEVLSPWIGDGAAVPFEDEEFDAWTIINANGDSITYPDEEFGDYTEETTWHTGYNGIGITSSVDSTDDWAISPRIRLEAGKKYTLTVNSFVGYGNEPGYVYSLAVGTDDVADAMTAVKEITVNTQLKKDAQSDVVTLVAVNEDEAATAAEGDEEVINVPAGLMTIGLHAYLPGSVTISRVELKEAKQTGLGLTSAEGTMTLRGRTLLLGFTASRLAVYDLQGRCVMTAADVEGAISLEHLSAGIYTVAAERDGRRVTTKVILK